MTHHNFLNKLTNLIQKYALKIIIKIKKIAAEKIIHGVKKWVNRLLLFFLFRLILLLFFLNLSFSYCSRIYPLSLSHPPVGKIKGIKNIEPRIKYRKT